MSKKKNTLNDLEEFLKLQASSLVTPAPLGEKVTEKAQPARETSAPITTVSVSTTEENLIDRITKLARNKDEFYELIIRVTENLPNKTKEDILLINTALYLKGGAHWKETVKDYWKKKS